MILDPETTLCNEDGEDGSSKHRQGPILCLPLGFLASWLLGRPMNGSIVPAFAVPCCRLGRSRHDVTRTLFI